MTRRITKGATYGGAGAGVGYISRILLGARCFGMLGTTSVGISALPVFLIGGTVIGFAVLGLGSLFKK